MAKFFDTLLPQHIQFIQSQKIFFTGTASQTGRVNLSPKGMDTFRCLDESSVAYLDLTGSGNETAAHVHDNGRITLMFCSFEENPLILRIYGQGQVLSRRDPAWMKFHTLFPSQPAERQIFLIRIQAVQTSCGYAVPFFDYRGERETLQRWAEKKGEEGIYDYWRQKNQVSIDGLPTHILDEGTGTAD